MFLFNNILFFVSLVVVVQIVVSKVYVLCTYERQQKQVYIVEKLTRFCVSVLFSLKFNGILRP